MLPEKWIESHIAQRVVHPSHVPFQIEAEAPNVGRPGHRWPGSGLLGDHEHTGMLGMQDFVETLQKRDCFEILTAAESIGNPFAWLPRVIQVQHRSDRINAQTV